MAIGNSDAARANILARIRAARGLSGPATDAERQALQPQLGARTRGPLRPLAGDLAARFCTSAEAMQSSTARAADWREAAAAAASYLRERQLPLAGCMSADIAHLDWAAAGLALEPRPARDGDLVGITGSFAAIAETGTLMLASGPERPGSVSLLPETHIALLAKDRIIAYMEDAWELLRAEFGHPPRAVNFVSGPSRTADIEQTLVLGAHGPYRVHIIVVG